MCVYGLFIYLFIINCHISYFQVLRMFSQANSNITVCGFHIQYIFNSLLFFIFIFIFCVYSTFSIKKMFILFNFYLQHFQFSTKS